MKLKYKLPLISMLILITAFVSLWFGTQRAALSFIMDYQHKMSLLNIESRTQGIEHRISSGKQRLKIISEKIDSADLNWQYASSYFYNELEGSVFDKIGLVYSDKTYNITGTDEKGDLSDREYLERTFKGETIISDPVYSKSDGIYQIVISNPIIDKGIVVGAVIGTIPMANIEDLIYSLNIEGDGYGILINKYGEVILHPRSNETPYDNFFEYIGIDSFHSSNGYVSYESFDGIKKYAFFKALEETELFAVISIGQKELYSPITSIFNKNLLIFSIVLILVLFLSILGIKKALTPINRLILGMKKVEEGDYTLQIPIDKDNEIGDIAIQFNKTIEAISLRDEELQALNEEITASFEEINETSDKLLNAYDEIAKRLQNEQLINTLSEKLYSIKELDELLEAILIHTEEIINADRCAIYRYNEEKEYFELKGSINFSEDDKNVVFGKNEGTIGWVTNNKEELLITNAQEEPRFAPKYRWSKDVSMILQVPILNQNEEVIGIISYIGDNLNLNFVPFIKQLSKTISVTVQNSQLITEVKKTYFDIIKALVKAMELKDSYTSGHSERVMEYSLMLGKKLNLSKKELEVLRHGSILHDIGKLGIPDNVLLKPDQLTEEEYKLIKEHSVKGEAFIENLEFLQESLPIIRNHHERLDGMGYPDGLKDDEISLLVKIVTIADSYDAMTSKRAYRNIFNNEDAINELKRCKGTQFDSYLVDKFIEAILES